jgi:hypothetical protein
MNDRLTSILLAKVRTTVADHVRNLYDVLHFTAREAMNTFVEELCSKELDVFIPCANGVNEIGFNREKLVPNPKFSDEKMLNFYFFIGKLFGSALRTGTTFPLPLSSLTWKKFVGDVPDRSDLEAIDQLTCQSLDSLLNIEKEGVTPDTFDSVIDFTFTTTSIHGKDVELVPGGALKKVTYCSILSHSPLVGKTEKNMSTWFYNSNSMSFQHKINK